MTKGLDSWPLTRNDENFQQLQQAKRFNIFNVLCYTKVIKVEGMIAPNPKHKNFDGINARAIGLPLRFAVEGYNLYKSKSATFRRNLKLAIFSFAFLVSAFAVTHPFGAEATGNVYYVSKTSCNDSYSGSEAQPWCTIQHAADTIAGGDTVHIASGTYDERVTITAAKSGASGNTTKFIGGTGVVVAQGMLVQSNYTELTDFEVTPGSSSVGDNQGQVQITGDYNTLSGFNIHNVVGNGFALANGASYNTIEDYIIDTVTNSSSSTRRGFGIITTAYNSGPDHTTLTNGIIRHHQGSAAIDMIGDYWTVEDITIEGGPSGLDAGSLDGDGIRVNYNTGSVIRHAVIHDLWEWYNSGQHTDCIQMWVGVYDLLIENSVLGTWQPSGGYDTSLVGSTNGIMAGSVPDGQHVDFKVQNTLFLGSGGNSQGGSVVLNQAGADLQVTLVNNTFWSDRPSLAGSTIAINNVYRSMYHTGTNPSVSDYNAYFWINSDDKSGTAIPSNEGSHSIGKTSGTKLSASTAFVDDDVTSTTDWGLTNDWSPAAESQLIGAGVGPDDPTYGSYIPTTDFNGNPRIGSTTDIGAFGYQADLSSNYYVAKTGCSDSYSGSEAQPWCTIQHAASAVSAGDTVYVKSGNYNERISISASGTASDPIEFIAYDLDNVPVVQQGFNLTGSYVQVTGFEITPGSTSAVQVQLSGSHNIADNINIHDLALGANHRAFDIAGTANTVQNSQAINWASYENTTVPAVTVASGTLKNTKFSGPSQYKIAELGDDAYVEGNEFVGPNEDILLCIEGSNVTVKDNKFYKIGRRVGTSTHTEGIGIQKTSQSGDLHDIVLDGNIFSNPPAPWVDSTDGNNSWEGTPFWIFLFGMNDPVYSDITIINNVFLPGADRWADMNPGPEALAGTRIIYNNLFLLGSDQLENSWAWKNNIYLESPNYHGDPSAADYNLWVNLTKDSRDGAHSITTTQTQSQLFNAPDTSAGTRYGLDADWSAKAGSAAINAGISTASDSYVPLLDMDGNSRVGATDIGPSEYQGDAPTTYTVSYSGNNNTGGTAPTDNNAYAADATVTVLGNTGSLVRTGYTFAGWNTSAGGGGTDRAPASTFAMPSANVILYAKWNINTYTLTYNSGSHGSVTGTTPQTVNYGANGSAVTAVADSGYHFVNWSDSSTQNPRTDTSVSANITVTANFALDNVDTYTVTFNSNGGSSVSPVTGVTSGSSISAPTPPTKTGYTFANWYKESGLVNLWNFSTDTVSANTTLYAKWTINTYTVSVAADPGAAGSVTGAGTYNYGTTASLTATSSAGYHFTSWSGDCSGDTNPYSLTNIGANKSCTANFTADEIDNPTYDITAPNVAYSEAGASVKFTGSLPSGATGINIEILSSDTSIHSMPDQKILKKFFSITATNQDHLVLTDGFSAHIVLDYPADIDANELRYTVMYWDGSAWSSEGVSNIQIDTENNRISFDTTHFSEFGIFDTEPAQEQGILPNLLPVTGENAVGLLRFSLILSLLALIGFLAFHIKKKHLV